MSSPDSTAGPPGGSAVAIIAALPGEVRALARLRPRGRARLPGGATLMLSGMGATRARAAAQRLADEGFGALVSWGIAAALAPGLDPGTLVLPGHVSDTDGRQWPTDAVWRQSVCERLVGRCAVSTDPLCEAVELMTTPEAKARLRAATGAAACDMESAAIAAVAASRGLGFLTVRAIVDDATMALPPVARAALDADGHLRPAALLAALAGRPHAMHVQLRALKQLAVAFRAARSSLAEAAGAFSLETHS